MSSANIKIGPPKLEDDHYETWKKDLKIWCKLTDIIEEKRALAVHLNLSGRARAATSELSVDDLEKKNGIDILLAKLDDIFLVDKGRRQFAAYHELHGFLRSRDTDINKFVNEFEHIYYNFALQGMQLPDPVQAFMLLASSNLNENERQLVMSAITDVTYANMKSALKRIFSDDVGVSVKSNLKLSEEIKTEPTFFGENEDAQVMYNNGYSRRGKTFWRGNSRGRGRGFSGGAVATGRGFSGEATTSGRWRAGAPAAQQQPSSVTRRQNSLGPDGNVSRCLICDSRFHWAKNCPDSYENSNKSTSNNDNEM